MDTAPKLIESSAQGYMFQTLKKCHSTRVNVYYYALNTGVFVLFVGIFGLVLYYCNKNKLTEYESNQKMVRDQHYVLSKIKYYKDETKNMKDGQVTGITELPFLES